MAPAERTSEDASTDVGKASRRSKSNRARHFGRRRPRVIRDGVPGDVRLLDPTRSRDDAWHLFELGIDFSRNQKARRGESPRRAYAGLMEGPNE